MKNNLKKIWFATMPVIVCIAMLFAMVGIAVTLTPADNAPFSSFIQYDQHCLGKVNWFKNNLGVSAYSTYDPTQFPILVNVVYNPIVTIDGYTVNFIQDSRLNSVYDSAGNGVYGNQKDQIIAKASEKTKGENTLLLSYYVFNFFGTSYTFGHSCYVP